MKRINFASLQWILYWTDHAFSKNFHGSSKAEPQNYILFIPLPTFHSSTIKTIHNQSYPQPKVQNCPQSKLSTPKTIHNQLITKKAQKIMIQAPGQKQEGQILKIGAEKLYARMEALARTYYESFPEISNKPTTSYKKITDIIAQVRSETEDISSKTLDVVQLAVEKLQYRADVMDRATKYCQMARINLPIGIPCAQHSHLEFEKQRDAQGIEAMRKYRRIWQFLSTVAIQSMLFPTPDAHVENEVYAKGLHYMAAGILLHGEFEKVGITQIQWLVAAMEKENDEHCMELTELLKTYKKHIPDRNCQSLKQQYAINHLLAGRTKDKRKLMLATYQLKYLLDSYESRYNIHAKVKTWFANW